MRENSLALHLVGETIDARRAHLAAQAGALVQLVRGVYIDAIADVDAVVLGHAVRIAHYLYAAAYLSSASAVLLGPTADGRLFISGRRNQRTRLRGLEIVQNEAPAQSSTAPAIVGDDMGEIHIRVSSPRQRVLEAFRLRSEHASAITEAMRAQMAARLVDEYGSPQAAADALWELARANGWYREGEGAERYLLARATLGKVPPNKAAFDLLVAWHGQPLGTLQHDGFEWRWRGLKTGGPPLVRETTPGQLPPFIAALLPEGWLAQVLQQHDERQALRSGRRYLSNIAIVESRAELDVLPADVMRATLAQFSDAGCFTGEYAGPARGEFDQSFEQNLARLYARAETPRLSGVQIKAPMYLELDGRLVPAVDAPFTHILKPAGTAGFEALPAVEWLCLELGRAVGFTVPAAALIAMPDGMAPALVVERFDIRQGPNDRRLLATEDFCSVLGLPAVAKYDGTIERVARALRPLSTDPAADLELLLLRATFAWLIADGDMHLKNLALLKIAQPGARRFTTVRLAPLYDTVTTRVFPGLGGDRMALKLNGKDDRLTRADFLSLARTIDVPAAMADAALAQLVTRISKAASILSLPNFMDDWEAQQRAAAQVQTIVMERAAALL
jgi:serine/threonine-protein kinase HipA